jgi:uncharacterized protein
MKSVSTYAPAACAIALLLGLAVPGTPARARVLQPDMPPPLPKLAAQPRQDQPRITDGGEASDAWIKRLQAQAAAKNAAAAWELGLLYFHGISLNASTARAQELFATAYRAGERRAAAGLAVCAVQACSGPADPAAARRWTAELGRSEPARALMMEWLALQRNSTPESAPGEGLLKRAAALGDMHALIELGLLQAQAESFAEAIRLFERAADAGSGAARHNAQALKTRLAESGLSARDALSYEAVGSLATRPAHEIFLLAQRMHRGSSGPLNLSRTIELYRAAADQGDLAAKKMLGLLFSQVGANGLPTPQWFQLLSNTEVDTEGPSTSTPPVSQGLLREPSLIYDYLPARWRTTFAASNGAAKAAGAAR